MNVKLYRNIFFVTLGLVIMALSGCAPEENDLVPPMAAFDDGVATIPTPTTATTIPLISGTMDAGSTVEVDITSGASVNNLVQSGTAWSFDVSGLIEGENIILVSVADAVGNTRTIQLFIEVDLTGPVMTIDQFPVTTQAGFLSFAGTVSEADSTVVLEVYDSSVVPVQVASAAATVDADIWSISNLDLTGLADGDYTIIVTGTDRLLNPSSTPATATMSIAAANPAFAITTPTLPVILDTDVDQQIFTGTTDIGNTIIVSPYGVVTSAAGAAVWSATVSVPGGKTALTFTADNGGVVTEEKVLIFRDQTAPFIVEWDSPATNQITVLFNETMNFSTIDVSNLLVVDSNETAVAINAVSIDAADKTVTFTTATNLTADETYTASLQTTDTFLVEDGRGNSLAASYSWTFKK